MTFCQCLQAGGVNELLSKTLLYSLLNRIKVRRACFLLQPEGNLGFDR